MCPNCGSCFSKKSNLYNHLHRGKGCPKRSDKDSPVSVIPKKDRVRREKIKYAVVKDEAYNESDEELSDLVIDDRNQSIDNAERVTETEDDLDDEEVEEHVEESYVEVHEPANSLRSNSNRLEFLRANRNLLQPRSTWQESSDSKSTPSPPPAAARAPASAPLNNLHLLADIAMAHTQYSSDTSGSDHESHDQDQVQTRSPVSPPSPVRSPLNLSRDVKVEKKPETIIIKRPVSSSSKTPPGYREIKPGVTITPAKVVTQPGVTGVSSVKGVPGVGPAKLVTAAGQPVQILQSGGAGLAYQMIPVQTSVQTSVQPVMMIQSNGGHVPTLPTGVLQLPNQVITIANPTTSLFTTNMGRPE